MERSALRVVPWRDGLPQHDVETALEALAQEVDDIYLHLDLDVLDPSVGRGIVDPRYLAASPARSSQLAEYITQIRERLTLAGATIATYTPANDDGRTLTVAMDSTMQLAGHPS